MLHWLSSCKHDFGHIIIIVAQNSMGMVSNLLCKPLLAGVFLVLNDRKQEIG
jgi:hypothetical protein